MRPLLGSTPNRGPVVAALYKGGCVGAAMSRPPFRFSALSVGAGPRPARRIAGKPDAERIPCGRMVSVSAGDGTGKHWADHIRPYGMTAAGIRGRTLCAPTGKGAPNRRGRTKGGRGATPGGTSPYKHRYAGAHCAPLRKKGHQTDGARIKGGRGAARGIHGTSPHKHRCVGAHSVRPPDTASGRFLGAAASRPLAHATPPPAEQTQPMKTEAGPRLTNHRRGPERFLKGAGNIISPRRRPPPRG